jgi:hypothetical protein
MVEDFANTLNLKVMQIIRQMFAEDMLTQCKSFGGTKEKRQGRLLKHLTGIHAASNTSPKVFQIINERVIAPSQWHVILLFFACDFAKLSVHFE